MPAQFRLPSDDQRIAVLGRTGSGKSQFAVWLLAQRSWDRIPWIIFDFKGDHLLAKLGAVEIDIVNPPPATAGLYIAHVAPGQIEEVEAFLWEVWRRGSIGLFLDEGYMIKRSDAWRAILTQGRSKRIPVIALSQRPAWVDTFTFSEADYFAVFALNRDSDRKTVKEFFPTYNDPPGRFEGVPWPLPKFWSQYYVVNEDTRFFLRPVPGEEELIEVFEERLRGPDVLPAATVAARDPEVLRVRYIR